MPRKIFDVTFDLISCSFIFVAYKKALKPHLTLADILYITYIHYQDPFLSDLDCIYYLITHCLRGTSWTVWIFVGQFADCCHNENSLQYITNLSRWQVGKLSFVALGYEKNVFPYTGFVIHCDSNLAKIVILI
jgi:hypothetical protein